MATLAAMTAGYTFDTTVTVGGKTATHVSGRSVSGGSEFIVESGGQSVTYRTLPPQAWVLKPGADWVQVDGQVSSGAALDALVKPQATKVVSDTTGGLVLDVSYPASALGLSGAAAVTVRMMVAPDGSVTATYSTDTSVGKAESTTILRPVAGLDPVVAPSAAPSPSG
jgi:autotransporter adhesin